MKAFDRYLGEIVTLPEEVEPGRYRLLNRVTLNEQSVLEKSDLLMSDGRERCLLDGESHGFRDSARRGDGDPVASLILRSVQTLAMQYRAQPFAPPSPLIPSELANSVKLDDRDKELKRVIDKGHLEEIARRPRYAMKYEAEVTQIHRVRRMAPKAIEHLAAHSEDWLSQTVFGVLPKRLLALLSEDEWSIYENKVYTRLLDELYDYLCWRLTETQKINDKYEEKRKLEQAEHIHHRLRDRLFKLWGGAMGTAATEQGLKDSGDAIKFLRSAKMRVGALRQSELYQNVPRSARVPAQLRNTNILMHDQHYRHLRTLWGKYQTRSMKKQTKPEQVLADNRRALADFAQYLRMMIHRVMTNVALVDAQPEADAIGFTFGRARGRVSFADDEIRIRLEERELVIVPAMTESDASTPLRPDASGRIVIACLSAGSHKDALEPSAPDAGSRVINPFDFYGEERLALMVERFLWFPAFAAYGHPIGPLPREALVWFESKSLGVVENRHWRSDVPLSASDEKALHAWLKDASLNSDTKNKIARSVDRANLLALCRHCGEPAKFTPRNGDFTARCEACGTQWGIYRRGGRRVAQMHPDDGEDASFERVGSWSMEFEV